MQMKRAERLEMIKNDPMVTYMRSICEVYGYKVDNACMFTDGEPRVALYRADRSYGNMLPDLTLDVDHDWTNHCVRSFEWKIYTKCVGALSTDEYKAMLEKMNDALSCCKFLNGFDYSKLPVMPEHFDDDADYEA